MYILLQTITTCTQENWCRIMIQLKHCAVDTQLAIHVAPPAPQPAAASKNTHIAASDGHRKVIQVGEGTCKQKRKNESIF